MILDIADDAAERRIIEALIAEQDRAWAAGDAEAFAARALPGLSFTSILGMSFVGREPFRLQQHAHPAGLPRWRSGAERMATMG